MLRHSPAHLGDCVANMRGRLLGYLTTIMLCACDRQSSDTHVAQTAQPKTDVLYFANWEGEIGAHTLADFKAATGIRGSEIALAQLNGFSNRTPVVS